MLWALGLPRYAATDSARLVEALQGAAALVAKLEVTLGATVLVATTIAALHQHARVLVVVHQFRQRQSTPRGNA